MLKQENNEKLLNHFPKPQKKIPVSSKFRPYGQCLSYRKPVAIKNQKFYKKMELVTSELDMTINCVNLTKARRRHHKLSENMICGSSQSFLFSSGPADSITIKLSSPKYNRMLFRLLKSAKFSTSINIEVSKLDLKSEILTLLSARFQSNLKKLYFASQFTKKSKSTFHPRTTLFLQSLRTLRIASHSTLLSPLSKQIRNSLHLHRIDIGLSDRLESSQLLSSCLIGKELVSLKLDYGIAHPPHKECIVPLSLDRFPKLRNIYIIQKLPDPMLFYIDGALGREIATLNLELGYDNDEDPDPSLTQLLSQITNARHIEFKLQSISKEGLLSVIEYLSRLNTLQSLSFIYESYESQLESLTNIIANNPRIERLRMKERFLDSYEGSQLENVIDKITRGPIKVINISSPSLLTSGKVEKLTQYVGRLTHFVKLHMKFHFENVDDDMIDAFIGAVTKLNGLRSFAVSGKMPPSVGDRIVSRISDACGEFKSLRKMKIGFAFNFVSKLKKWGVAGITKLSRGIKNISMLRKLKISLSAAFGFGRTEFLEFGRSFAKMPKLDRIKIKMRNQSKLRAEDLREFRDCVKECKMLTSLTIIISIKKEINPADLASVDFNSLYDDLWNLKVLDISITEAVEQDECF